MNCSHVPLSVALDSNNVSQSSFELLSRIRSLTGEHFLPWRSLDMTLSTDLIAFFRKDDNYIIYSTIPRYFIFVLSQNKTSDGIPFSNFPRSLTTNWLPVFLQITGQTPLITLTRLWLITDTQPSIRRNKPCVWWEFHPVRKSCSCTVRF